MFTLRRLITPVVKTNCTSALSQARSVGYLHRGPRVRGLVRDEAEYLVSPKGMPYDLNDTTVGPLKKLLGDKYSLPEELMLQVQTHKSFAHGSKPFNEKIAIYGAHFLKYKTTLHTVTSVGMDGLGTQTARAIISPSVLAEFVRRAGLADSVYWKKRNALHTDSKISGEDSVLARTCEAIVGAILLQRGKAAADEFVDNVLLSGENSLLEIVKEQM